MADNKRTFITCEIPAELLEEIDGYAIKAGVSSVRLLLLVRPTWA